MPSINATPKSTFQSSPGSPLIGPSLPPSTLSPLFNPQSPKLVNNNLNSPKMDYSPKPGFTLGLNHQHQQHLQQVSFNQ